MRELGWATNVWHHPFSSVILMELKYKNKKYKIKKYNKGTLLLFNRFGHVYPMGLSCYSKSQISIEGIESTV